MVLLQHRLNVKLSQRQILTPGLVQMVSVLALNKLELKDMINAEMVENPVLEELEDSVPLLDEVGRKEEDRDRAASAATEEVPTNAEKKDPFEEIDFGSFFQDYLDPGYRTRSEMEEIERPSFENFLSKQTNLTDHLAWQLGALNLRAEVREAADLIIGNLNEDGYLIATDDELMGIAPAASPEADAETAKNIVSEAKALGLAEGIEATPAPEEPSSRGLAEAELSDLITSDVAASEVATADVSLPADVAMSTDVSESKDVPASKFVASDLSSDRTFSDREFADRTFSDRVFSDRTFSDRTFSDRTFSDRRMSPHPTDPHVLASSSAPSSTSQPNSASTNHSAFSNHYSGQVPSSEAPSLDAQFLDAVSVTNRQPTEPFLAPRDASSSAAAAPAPEAKSTKAQRPAYKPSFSLADLNEALEVIRQLDPPGVGCRDLRGCLLYQLRYHQQQLIAHKNGNGNNNGNAAGNGNGSTGNPVANGTAQVLQDASAIVDQHLRAVQNKQNKEIAKAISRPPEAVQQALDYIRTLDPRPGLRYNKVQARLIEPDVAFVKHGDEWLVIMNDEDLPQLRLNPAYKKLVTREGNDKNTRDYVKERYKSAIQLIKNIEQRKQTITKVCYSIVVRQQDFLEYGIDQLKPMMIKEVAEEIGVHPSTVSRAVSSKYVHTPQGVFELRYFFSESVQGPEGGGTSLLILKRRVKKLIDEEDSSRPLTDEQITRILQSQGIQVTRRTVAKYREDMRIPSTHQRRVKK